MNLSHYYSTNVHSNIYFSSGIALDVILLYTHNFKSFKSIYIICCYVKKKYSNEVKCLPNSQPIVAI